MTASEAKKAVLAGKSEKTEKQEAEVRTKIEGAVKSLKFSCTYGLALLPQVRQILENDGYRVASRQCGINEIETVISWE